ncbi:NADPH2:quinone reductase [Motilibacter rhizosphaerae]|uniref:NADPH2:quinone reductase n=1 Tax=Motilibacter rhizosphaerae TaxID=598652 RepID=A0A4V2F2T6_9ACTN|nr:NADPH:quinone reductase [Motilibacter rhizosphaerae]RZS80024.1 NADPH2:quinone reductase [Motilibacter rhizosphaerae]
MRAITYSRTGGSDVLQLTERPVPEPGPGEVRVRVAYSGVNPTDWKAREGGGPGQPLKFPEQVPDQDGSGVVDAVGPGAGRTVGERVWLWECAWQRAEGTAQEHVVVPADHAVPLPDGASLELGASLGIPAMTAHRALSLAEGAPAQLSPGALEGRTVLVQGGAGAVGNAAIQLARWAGARVVTTVSGPDKARLAERAGAHLVVNYKEEDVVAAVRGFAAGGVDVVVEVAPSANAEKDAQLLARGAVVAIYANDGGDEFPLAVRQLLSSNSRWQFVLVYTIPEQAKIDAVAAVSAAVADGALGVGDERGLPLHVLPLERIGEAHDAVAQGRVGKVLVEVGGSAVAG